MTLNFFFCYLLCFYTAHIASPQNLYYISCREVNASVLVSGLTEWFDLYEHDMNHSLWPSQSHIHISTQVNSYGRFWSDVWDNTLLCHHHNNVTATANEGTSLGRKTKEELQEDFDGTTSFYRPVCPQSYEPVQTNSKNVKILLFKYLYWITFKQTFTHKI